ncbi:MAG: KH domain-containing protein [Desulfurococcaceae archaeon]
MSGEETGRFILGVTRLYEKIPTERVGVLLSNNGSVKKEIEEKTKTIITVNPDTGAVVIEPAFPHTSALDLMKAQNIVKAIGYGFSPERAFRLLEDDQTLEVIDVRQYVGNKPNHVRRVLGRVIGEEGRARRTLEELTSTYISVYEPYVAIIGDYETANIAKRAIEMLIEGRMHSTVYKYVDREMFSIRRRRMTELWRKEFK